MFKYELSAATVVQDFNRRGIAPDWEHDVKQGILRLWRINNSLIAELYIKSDSGKSIPGTISIRGSSRYVNTTSPQEIADDLTVENKLSKVDIELINAMPIHGIQRTTQWLTTVEIEGKYELPKGSVRRDIHRNKFITKEIRKVGRDWTIKPNAAKRLYDKK